jgi:hypothetical protein
MFQFHFKFKFTLSLGCLSVMRLSSKSQISGALCAVTVTAGLGPAGAAELKQSRAGGRDHDPM